VVAGSDGFGDVAGVVLGEVDGLVDGDLSGRRGQLSIVLVGWSPLWSASSLIRACLLEDFAFECRREA
jgi:hypothetical protein